MSAENKVPAIRFEGFSGEWEECTLSKFVSSLDAGVSVNSGDKPANESEFGILKTSCVTNGIFEPYENKIVFETEEINRLKEPVLKNTIIISRMNTPTLVGANAYIDRDFENYYLPDRLWAAKPASIGDLQFIAYILGSSKGRAALSELATGTSGSMKNISKPSVFELKFQVPKDSEQTKIGEYFQQLDSLIAQHQQKHDKLLNLKKALLEKMFPKQGATEPAIRFKGFSGAWEEKVLGDITESYSGGTPQVGNEKYYKGDIPFIRSAEINKNTTELFISGLGLENSSARLISKGCILYALYGATSGEVGIAKINGAINQAILAITPHSEISVEFIRQWLRKNKSQIISTYLQGGQGNLSGGIVKSLVIAQPHYEEQTKIGTLFKHLDTLITQHQAQLNKLNNIKQACLAKMFV